MKNFNIYTYLNENNYTLLTRIKTERVAPYGVKRSESINYCYAIVQNELNGQECILHQHRNIYTKKEYNFLVDINGKVTKINGGRLGSTFVEDSVNTLENRLNLVNWVIE